MVCEHLAALEAAILRAGVPETFRGQAWSQNCREWVYFACVLDRAALRVAQLDLEHVVADTRGLGVDRGADLDALGAHHGRFGARLTGGRERGEEEECEALHRGPPGSAPVARASSAWRRLTSTTASS